MIHMMTQREYIEERLNDQIKWYDNKSISTQQVYKRIKIGQIIFTALIPFLAGLVDKYSSIIIIISLLGVAVTILEGYTTLGKFHEHWIEYRRICETLQHEKYMFLTNAGVYSGSDDFPLFVERIESIISQENLNWAALQNNDNT